MALFNLLRKIVEMFMRSRKQREQSWTVRYTVDNLEHTEKPMHGSFFELILAVKIVWMKTFRLKFPYSIHKSFYIVENGVCRKVAENGSLK